MKYKKFGLTSVLLITFILIFSTSNACKKPQVVKTIKDTIYLDSFVFVPPSEKYRPYFHFTPEHMWMNDPNGMVYFKGEYHLFYQYHPESTVWGPMHWGHAVSQDLVNWKHLPIALAPDDLGYIFSGSAVIDWENTTGFGSIENPPMVAIFTHHDPNKEKSGRNDFQYQSLAYSLDKGRSWTKYSNNPVLPNSKKIRDFRDPKVFYHEPSQKWIMIIAAQNKVKIYSSPDLKNWVFMSDFGEKYGNHDGVWECPDLFPIYINGTKNQKWVLLQSIGSGGPHGGSGTQYFIGDFDGKDFKLDPTFKSSVEAGKSVWLDWGKDNYAGVTWSDIPNEDGRRIFIGWMSNWQYATVVPTKTWRSSMTIPREIVLTEQPEGYRLSSLPVKEIESKRRRSYSNSNKTIDSNWVITNETGFDASSTEWNFKFKSNEISKFSIELFNDSGEVFTISIDRLIQSINVDRTKSGENLFSNEFAKRPMENPYAFNSDLTEIRLLVDVTSVEIFVDGGKCCITNTFFSKEKLNKMRLVNNRGELEVLTLKAYQIF